METQSRIPIPNEYEFDQFIDPLNLEKEGDAFKRQFGECISGLKPHLDALPENVFGEWCLTANRNTELSNASKALIGDISRLDPKEDFSTTVKEIFPPLIRTAANLLAMENLNKQRKLAKKHLPPEKYDRYAEILRLLYEESYVKMEGVSINDIMTNPNISPVQSYRFIAESDRIGTYPAFAKKVFEENSDLPSASAYPNITKQKIYEAADCVVLLSILTPEVFEHALADRDLNLFPNIQGTQKEILTKAQEMIKTMSRVKQKIHSVLFKPNSPYFPPLLDAILNSLTNKDCPVDIVSLAITLGFNTRSAIVGDYRKARGLSKTNNRERSFYETLANFIKTFVIELPEDIEILTADNLMPIIDGSNKIDGLTAPTVETLRESARAVFQKSAERTCSIDNKELEQIDWKFLVPPQRVKFGFLKDTYKQFYLKLHYQNENGEALDIALRFDVEKGRFEWPFIESLDDPEMESAKKGFLLATESVLDYIQKQLESISGEKPVVIQKPKNSPLEIEPSTPANKISPKEPYVPRGKENAKTKRRKPLTPLQEVLEGTIVIPKPKKRIKRTIALHEEKARSAMTSKGIQPIDQEKIIEAIERFNQNAQGTLKHLKGIGCEDNEPVFELKIGDFRVLVITGKPDNGHNANGKHIFEIITIGNRKNIFKKKH